MCKSVYIIILPTIYTNLLIFHGQSEAASWCPWSTEPACRSIIIRPGWNRFDKCRLSNSRVCACPEPDKGISQHVDDFCSSNYYSYGEHNHGFAREYSSSNLYLKSVLCKRQYEIVYSSSGTYDCEWFFIPTAAPWCGWSPWSSWSATCGRATRLRQNVCKCYNRTHGISLCNGKFWDTERMSTTLPVCQSLWCNWLSWTSCSCDSVRTSRRRNCKCPNVPGSECKGSNQEFKECDLPSYCTEKVTPKSIDTNDDFWISDNTLDTDYTTLIIGISTAAVVVFVIFVTILIYFKRTGCYSFGGRGNQLMAPIMPAPAPVTVVHPPPPPQTVTYQPAAHHEQVTLIPSAPPMTNDNQPPPSYNEALAMQKV